MTKPRKFPAQLMFEDGRTHEALVPYTKEGGLPDVVEAGGGSKKRRFKKTRQKTPLGQFIYREVKGKR